jgi:hypothetical protein
VVKLLVVVLCACGQPRLPFSGASDGAADNSGDAPTVVPGDAPTDVPDDAPTDVPGDAPTDVPGRHGLRIVSPAAGSDVIAGATVTVQVVPENGFVPIEVDVSTRDSFAYSTTPPFTIDFPIPREALGRLLIAVIGFSAEDEVVDSVVAVRARTNAVLQTVHILQQDVFLFGVGTQRQLGVLGNYDDGVTRDITSSAVGTSYLTSTPGVVTVSSEGMVVAVGFGNATMVARNGTTQDSITVTVQADTLPAGEQLHSSAPASAR